MNISQEISVKEVRDFGEFATNNSSTISNDPFLTSAFNRIDTIRMVVENLLILIKVPTKSTTAATKACFDNMAQNCYELSSTIIGWGNLTDNKLFINLEGFSKSELFYGAMDDTLTKSRLISQLIEQNQEECTACGITPERHENLKLSILEFTSLHNAPLKAIKERKQNTEKLDQELDKFKAIRDKALKKYMDANYNNSEHADFYEAYTRALSNKMPESSPRAIVGTFRDENDHPLRDVTITIDDETVEVHGGKEGRFYISKVAPGEHKLVFSIPSYVPIIEYVICHPNQTIVLDLQFKSIPVTHPQ